MEGVLCFLLEEGRTQPPAEAEGTPPWRRTWPEMFGPRGMVVGSVDAVGVSGFRCTGYEAIVIALYKGCVLGKT